MDHYGIGAAVKGATEVYFTGARRTGRTTSLITSLKDGDRIVTVNSNEAERLRRMLTDRGLEVSVVVLDIRHPDPYAYGTPQGRTVFCHMWVEAYYRQIIERSEKTLDELQNAMSGWQEAHEETRQRAIEIAKWQR